MTRINLSSSNELRTNEPKSNASKFSKDANCLAWGKTISANASVFVFAAALIVCSVTVGCSSDKPKPVSANNQIPVTPTQQTAAVQMPASIAQPASKPAKKKASPKKPATVNYTDKTYGVAFEYPRRYAIETGDAAAELLMSSPVPMNFVQPGGVALAAVELPETNYTNTDFSSAFFNVSVHKTLTADQCGEFSVPQPRNVEKTAETAETAQAKPDAATTLASSIDVAKQEVVTSPSDSKPDMQVASVQGAQSTGQSGNVKPASTTDSTTTVSTSESSSSASNSKLMVGDLELRATEAVSGEGSRQSDSKYFHVYQNGACYEFALNVTTDASEEGLVKHVDRDKVFNRLEQILSTVKINGVTAPEVTAEAPKPAAVETPAQ
jgi:hypothetical protein